MFAPTQLQVRQFFCETYRKFVQKLPMSPMELQAADWIEDHPEYHAVLVDSSQAEAAVFDVDAERANPFLHLSMHLTLQEQCSIDQPQGVRALVQALALRKGSLHEAHHEAMEALGQMIWQSQRSGLPPDGHAYLEDLRRRASLL